MNPPEPWSPLIGSAAAFGLAAWLTLQSAFWALPIVLVILLMFYNMNRARWADYEEMQDLQR